MTKHNENAGERANASYTDEKNNKFNFSFATADNAKKGAYETLTFDEIQQRDENGERTTTHFELNDNKLHITVKHGAGDELVRDVIISDPKTIAAIQKISEAAITDHSPNDSTTANYDALVALGKLDKTVVDAALGNVSIDQQNTTIQNKITDVQQKLSPNAQR